MSSNRKNNIRILIVEHNPDDIELLLEELKVGKIDFVTEIVKEKQAYYNAITSFIPDIILSDYSLPSFHGQEAFDIREELAPGTPFIFVSGSIGEERSVEYIRNGVTDYVLKDKLFTLAVKVKRALEEARERQEKKMSQQQLVHNAGLLERAQQLAHMGSWELNFTDNIFVLSGEGCRIFGFLKAENKMPFAKWSSLVHHDDLDRVMRTFFESKVRLKEACYNHRIILKDGSIRDIYSESKFELDTEGNATGMYGIVQDVTDRNKNESALRDAYNDRITVLERIDDGFFAIDKNSIVVYWNKRAELLLNIKKEEVIGKNLHTVFANTGTKVFYDYYQAALSEKKTIHFREFSLRTGKWFEVSAYASDNGLSVYFKDVTEHTIASDKLKESELRYRSLNEQATDAICITDAAMKFIEINPYACETFGYTKEEALQLSLPDVLFTEDLAENPLKVAELKLGKTIRNERRLKRKNGTAVNMEVSTKIMDDGRLIMFGHDITERKRTELLISESEKKYRQIVETAQEGIWLIDENNHTTFVNNTMAVILGYSVEEMIGKENYFFMNEEWKQKACEHIADRKLVVNENHDFKYVMKGGKEVWTNISTNPLFDNSGKYAGALAMVTDISERKKTEQEIGWLINNTEESFILLNHELEIISFNDRAQKLYSSYLGKELKKGSYILDYANPNRYDKVKDIYQRVLNGAEEVDEIAIPLAGGEMKNFAFKYKPARDEQDTIIGAFVSAIDITEKKEAEIQKDFERRDKEALINTTTDFMWSVTNDFKLIAANKAFINSLKAHIDVHLQSGDDLLKKDKFPADYLLFWKDLYIKTLSGESHTEEIYFPSSKSQEASWREVIFNPIYAENSITGIACYSRNITQRKELEILLNKAYTLARTGSWEVDMVANALYWSPITMEIHEVQNGFVPDVQTAINFYKEGGSRNLISDALRHAIEEGIPWDLELEIITAKNNGKWVRVIGETAFENGKCKKITGSFQDITERKLTEIHLQELNENIRRHAKELAVSNAELEQFAYVASHDLQEPLRMITSFLTQLEKKYGPILDEKGRTYIGFAVGGAKRMRQIILDLLDFSRVGQSEENKTALDLNEVVSQIQILFQKKVEDINAVITVDHLPNLYGHRAPLHQVFQNLIGNALKYSVADKPCEIHISVTESADQWQFAVTDNGIGIGAEYYDKIFIIFQRLHNKDDYSGTGMGLAVTKKIIENLGGKIWVESVEGEGSTFYFTLKK